MRNCFFINSVKVVSGILTSTVFFAVLSSQAQSFASAWVSAAPQQKAPVRLSQSSVLPTPKVHQSNDIRHYRIQSHDLKILIRNLETLEADLEKISVVRRLEVKQESEISDYFDQRDSEGSLILYKNKYSLKRAHGSHLLQLNEETAANKKYILDALHKKLKTTILKKMVEVAQRKNFYNFSLKEKGSTGGHFTLIVRHVTVKDVSGIDSKEFDLVDLKFDTSTSQGSRRAIHEAVFNQIEIRRFTGDLYSLAVESLGLILPN